MNRKDGLDAFLRAKASKQPEVDWQAKKDRWLSEIAKLYDQIREWLEPLAKDGTVQYMSGTTTLEEDYIGSYQVDVLILVVGRQRVEFRPKGTFIVGANGRVDVRGPRAVRTIVLQKDQWFVVGWSPHHPPLPFDKDSFQTLLQEVMA